MSKSTTGSLTNAIRQIIPDDITYVYYADDGTVRFANEAKVILKTLSKGDKEWSLIQRVLVLSVGAGMWDTVGFDGVLGLTYKRVNRIQKEVVQNGQHEQDGQHEPINTDTN